MELTTDTVTPTRQLAAETLISVGFRTGTEVHAARANSSTSKCGRWMRYQARQMRVYASVTCETCLGKGAGE